MNKPPLLFAYLMQQEYMREFHRRMIALGNREPTQVLVWAPIRLRPEDQQFLDRMNQIQADAENFWQYQFTLKDFPKDHDRRSKK